MLKGTKVEKALTPEEKSVIANVRSLLDQLEQMEQAEGPEGGEPAPDEGMPVEMAATDGLPAGDEEGEDLMEDKLEVEKSEVANDDAEERIEELPEDDEAALKVLKAIMALGSGGQSVRKSANAGFRRPAGDDVQLRTLKVLKSIAGRLDEHDRALVGILEGVGVADQLVRKSDARRPLNPRQSSAEDVLRLIAKAARGQGAAEANAEPEGNLTDVLGSLFQ